MKILRILKSKKGMAAELVAISLMFVFTVLSVSALLTANSVLRGIQDDYSEEQAKIYALTLSQAIGDQLQSIPDIHQQYLDDSTNFTVSENLSSYLFERYRKTMDTSPIEVSYKSDSSSSVKSGCSFDVNISFEGNDDWNDIKIHIKTKATYKDSTYFVVKSYTMLPIEGSAITDLNDPNAPCKWHEI